MICYPVKRLFTSNLLRVGNWTPNCQNRGGVDRHEGPVKLEHRLDQCWLKGAQGDAINAIGVATGYNIRWLMRAIAFLRA